MLIVGIDPGTTQSALVSVDETSRPTEARIVPNEEALLLLRSGLIGQSSIAYVEMIASYGMPVGREVFETVVWIGRFIEAWESRGGTIHKLYRSEVKSHLCHSQKANDAAIRQALLDRYGPGKDIAVGLKHRQGPLYGIKGDMWAALAVAVTGYDRERAASSFLEGSERPGLELVA